MRATLVKWLCAGLSLEQRTVILNSALSTLGALPLGDSIKTDASNRLVVNGQVVDLDTAIRLRESAKAALDNSARLLVREQVKFLAITMGVHQHANPEQGLFAKAALWHGAEEEKLLQALAG